MMRWVPYQAPNTMIRKPSKRGLRRRQEQGEQERDGEEEVVERRLVDDGARGAIGARRRRVDAGRRALVAEEEVGGLAQVVAHHQVADATDHHAQGHARGGRRP